MIRLTYANYVERLVDVLAARLDRRVRDAVDIFEPQFVIVPNENVEAFLKLGVSQRNGIAANLRFENLLSFFESRLPLQVRPDPDGPARRPRLVDRDVLHALLLGLLDDRRVMGREQLAPLQRYLDVGSDRQGQRELRRFQLADQLATLFMEYRFARPEMIVRWRSGTALDDTRFAATERWQRALWVELQGPGGALWRVGRDAGIHWVHLERLLLDRHISQHLVGQLPPAVHVFGYSHVSRAFREVFMALGEHTELYIYHLNPCMEFWEDVLPRWKHPDLSGRFEPRQTASGIDLLADDDDPFGLTSREDCLPLQLWGRPGRETVRLLNALTECDFDSGFVDPVEEQATSGRFVRGEACTLLAQLQRDILFREPPPSPGAAAPLPLFAADVEAAASARPGRRTEVDDSIRILACPSIQREVEIIASHIWQLAHDDFERDAFPPLRFNDIAVLVPTAQREAYLTRIQAVFAEAWDLPHNVIDLGAGAVSRCMEAVHLLLALPFGRFTREELLVLLTHPNVVEQLDGIDPEEWITWCDQLGIVHGADQADHAETYIDQDLFNWDQGIKRLVLGAFTSASPLTDDAGRPWSASADSPVTIEIGAQRYAPRPVPLDRLDSVSMFAELVRDLIGDARFARRARLPLSEWARFFITQVVHYLRPANDGDERLLDHCAEAFEAIADLDLDGRPVGYRTAHALAMTRLDELSARRGQYLADGVVVSSLAPMRAMPFRVVFLAGMGEGAFPAPDPRSPLDLRAANRRPGDVSPRERDLYLFLETLVSTRDHVFVSWVARDEQTGDPLAPSAVIDELRSILARSYLTPEAVELLTEHHPLRRFDRSYFPELAAANSPPQGGDVREADRGGGPAPNHIPEARIEAQIAALREDLEQAADDAQAPIPPREALHRLMSDSEYAALEELLAIPHVAALLPEPREPTAVTGAPAVITSIEPEVIVLPLAAVRRFLESPLQGAARDVLRMRDDSTHEEIVAREDEVFETDLASNTVLLRDIITEAINLTHRQQPGGRTLSGQLLAEIYDHRAATLQRMGHHPIGPFGVAQRRRDLEALGAWRGNLQRIGLLAHAPLRRVALGQGSGAAFGVRTLGRGVSDFDVAEPLPPLTLHMEMARPGQRGRVPVVIELHGLTEALFDLPERPTTAPGPDDEAPRAEARPVGALTLVRSRVEPHHFLRAFLSHRVLAAAGRIGDDVPLDAVVASTARLRNAVWTTRFAPITLDQAINYLTRLTYEMVAFGHDYLLPIEAVCEAHLKQRWSLEARIEYLRDNPRQKMASRHGPIRDYARYHPPEQPDRMARVRLGPFLDAIGRRQPL